MILTIADSCLQTLSADLAKHLASDRAAEETGWLLLGIRDQTSVHVTDLVPAGENRIGTPNSIQFDAASQVAATKAIRDRDSRVEVLGVAHTHPSGRHRPSSGDLEGDKQWVQNLRSDGLFGIVSDGCVRWYSLGKDDDEYRAINT